MQKLLSWTTYTQFISEHHGWVAIGLVILTNLLVLGRFTPALGIYYDEYATFYILERFDFAHLINLAGGQARELAGVLIVIASSNIIVGHISMFIISTTCALLLRWLLCRVFPQSPQLGLLAALLYLTYPMYFMRVYLTALAIDGSLLVLLASMCLSYLALARQGIFRWLFLLLSLIAIPAYVNMYEMPVVLELLRPFVIWAALRDEATSKKTSFSKVILWSGVWVLVAGATVFYRLFLFEPYGFYAELNYNTSLYVPNETGGVLYIIYHSVKNLHAIFVTAWLRAIGESGNISSYGFIASSIVAFIGFAVTFTSVRQRQERLSRTVLKGLSFIIVGVGLSVVSHLVIQVTGRGLLPDAGFFSIFSRVYIVSYIGAVLSIVSGVWFLIRILPSRLGHLLVGGMMALMMFWGSLAHINWRESHVESWNDLRNFMWQLAEVAPNLEDGTTIIVDHDYSVIHLSYIHFIIGDLFYDNNSIALVLDSSTTSEEMPAFTVNNGDWGFGWQSNLEQAIVIHEDENGCVHLIDPSQPIPDQFNLSPEVLALLPMLPPNPSQFIISEPIEDIRVREHYLPRPSKLACEG